MRLPESIAERGSISGAGRALGMSYRRAWLLVGSMNTGFGRPAAEAQTGGRAGGGARLSAFGADVVRRYRAVEAAAEAAAAPFLGRLGQVGGA